MSDEGEEWRPIADFEGFYEVSNFARVRSLERRVRTYQGTRLVRGRIMKVQLLPTGYYHVGVSRLGHKSSIRIHILVAKAFLGPRPGPDYEVCHNDGDPANNRVDNLRWDTRSSNAQDRIAHGHDYHLNVTHCPHGHEYDAANTYVDGSGYRQCRTCKRNYQNDYYRFGPKRGRLDLKVAA